MPWFRPMENRCLHVVVDLSHNTNALCHWINIWVPCDLLYWSSFCFVCLWNDTWILMTWKLPLTNALANFHQLDDSDGKSTLQNVMYMKSMDYTSRIYLNGWHSQLMLARCMEVIIFWGGSFLSADWSPQKCGNRTCRAAVPYAAHRINALAFKHAKKCVWELFPSPIQLCFYRCDDISFFLCIYAFMGSCNEDLPTISISICLFYCLWVLCR